MKRNSNIRSTRPTIARLNTVNSIFERARDLVESASLDREFNRVTDIMESMIISPVAPSVYMESRRHYFTPATKSSIEGLEKVTLDSADDAATSFTCDICLEGLLDQLKIDVEEEKENNHRENSKARSTTKTARLPCSHIYHETCIVRWLQISHLCPLCRYQMPIV